MAADAPPKGAPSAQPIAAQRSASAMAVQDDRGPYAMA
jgi:hypothetical protein